MIAFAWRVFRFLGSRFALNIYFWLLTINLMYNNTVSQMEYEAKWYILFISINLLMLIILVYTNNFLLVPRLLVNKKRWQYFISIFSLTAFVAAIYTALQKYIIIHFPKIEIIQISFISGPINKEWTLSNFADEFQTYFVAFLMLVFLFTALWYMHDYARQQKLNQEVKKKQTEIELSFLKSQLNPHFLFNTLNNLYGLALKKSDDAPLSILKLSALMRYMLYDSNVDLISFDKEKEAIEAYIDLELLRLDKNHDLDLEIRADKNYQIPPLLWLPVLENAFKHGTSIISDKYLLEFSFTIRNNILNISSSNYFKENADEKNGGIGLENLQKRLAILFPGKYNFHKKSEENIYITSLTISLE